MLAKGEVPATVHFALGVDAAQRGLPGEARVHWEQASRLAPGMSAVANNLAWLLANATPPELDKALGLINPVVERFPQDPLYRHTRGHLFAKLQRWKDALPDLEAALPRYQSDADTHRTLAEVYEQLGAWEMAAEHRRLAIPNPKSPIQNPQSKIPNPRPLRI